MGERAKYARYLWPLGVLLVVGIWLGFFMLIAPERHKRELPQPESPSPTPVVNPVTPAMLQERGTAFLQRLGYTLHGEVICGSEQRLLQGATGTLMMGWQCAAMIKPDAPPLIFYCDRESCFFRDG